MITGEQGATMTETTTISVDEDLADELYARKARGESYADVIRRLLEDSDTEIDETAPGRRESDPSTEPAEPPATDEPKPDVTFDVVVDSVANDVLPGSDAKLDARIEAFEAVVEYLREHGSIKKATFKDAVFPEHDAEYETARSAWKNAIYPGLRTLADRTDVVENADESGVWRWKGDQ